MTPPMNCDQARDLFFELRHGRIEAPQRKAFEGHITHCEECRNYTEKLDTMLDEALLWEPADELAHQHQDVFDGIVAAIENGHELEEPAQSRSEPQPRAVRRSIPKRPSRGLWIAASVAALLAIAFISYLLLDSSPPSVAIDKDSPRQIAADEVIEVPPATDDETASEREGIRISDSLHIIADDDSVWSLEADDDSWELTARSGSVIVEFLPRHDGESLVVRIGDTRAVVTGTILYADADTEEFGVVAGGVTVEASDGEEASLTPRQSWRAGAVHEIDDNRWERLQRTIDVEAHEEKLERLRLESRDSRDEEIAAPEREAVVDSTKPAPETAEQREREEVRGPVHLRMEAEKALRERDFETAAERYEKLLTILPDTDRAAGSIRLDLARIYQHELNRPAQTIAHMEIFVETWPDDAVTPRVITELCRLVDDPDEVTRCRRR